MHLQPCYEHPKSLQLLTLPLPVSLGRSLLHRRTTDCTHCTPFCPIQMFLWGYACPCAYRLLPDPCFSLLPFETTPSLSHLSQRHDAGGVAAGGDGSSGAGGCGRRGGAHAGCLAGWSFQTEKRQSIGFHAWGMWRTQQESTDSLKAKLTLTDECWMSPTLQHSGGFQSPGGVGG